MPNKLNISEEFDPSLPLIEINRDLIIQALDNIFINAYESSLFNKNSYLKIRNTVCCWRKHINSKYKKIL